ncbi:TIGR03857 family LLM class F420-dependent oxidoreductase [Mycobacterium kiyosense]|nr:TIGR03857 family LLM class F420-dependent oxidoreductase [Mycobacterium kiyosense]
MSEAGKTGATSIPVVNDLSITLLPGRQSSSLPGLHEAIDAERLGFKRAWLPERYNVKEAGVLLGAMGAVTSRIPLGPGPLSISSRPPIVIASIAATFQSLFGERFMLGLGRSNALWLQGHGFTEQGYRATIDRARIMKQLWAGEVVDYDGPAGTYRRLTMIDRPEGLSPPPVVFFHLGGPAASRAAADPVWDEIALCNLVSAEAMAESIDITKAEAERQGRDPDSLHFIAPVTTAPDMDELETRAMVAARIVIGIQLPGMGDRLIELNGWDRDVVEDIRNHPQFADMNRALIDHSFHRTGLLGPAELVPERWMRHSAAIGSSEEVVAKLREFKAAGAHEVDLYGSTPAQNVRVIELWRTTADSKSEAGQHV